MNEAEAHKPVVSGGKWTTYRSMAEETVDRAVQECCLQPTGSCVTKGLLLEGAHGWSPTMFIRLVQDYGLENAVSGTHSCIIQVFFLN